MKRNAIKIAVFTLIISVTALSCIKKIKSPFGTGDGGGVDDPIPTKCDLMAKGTIEKCPQDESIWFINAYSFPLSSFAPMPTQLLLPENLPAQFKVNGKTVSFEYQLLPDSVPLKCWFCETPPLPYARKIKICSIKPDSNVVIAMKPVIYLYPTKESKVKVELKFKGNLTVTYPEYSSALNGWEVVAQKDGSLKNLADNSEHQYLFWEGAPATPYAFNMQEGFCVKGSETLKFLQTTLPKLGLSPKEYNDMIVFWLPRMVNNPYNLIHFAAEDYTASAPLKVSPTPDQVIRIFMAWQPSNTFVNTTEQAIATPKRSGFTVVEWGGAELPPMRTAQQPIL